MMKKILLLLLLAVILAGNARAQCDWAVGKIAEEQEYLHQKKVDYEQNARCESLVVVLDRMISANESIAQLYYSFFIEGQDSCCAHAADSALKYFKEAYRLDQSADDKPFWGNNEDHLYYPIVQLESYLNLPHDTSVYAPKKRIPGCLFDYDYFVPRPLDDWQHDYKVDLLKMMFDSRRKTVNISKILGEFDQSDLREPLPQDVDTVFRIVQDGVYGDRCYKLTHYKDGRWEARSYTQKRNASSESGMGVVLVSNGKMVVKKREVFADEMNQLRPLFLEGYAKAAAPRMRTGWCADCPSYFIEWRMGDEYKVVAIDYWPSDARHESKYAKAFNNFVSKFEFLDF